MFGGEFKITKLMDWVTAAPGNLEDIEDNPQEGSKRGGRSAEKKGGKSAEKMSGKSAEKTSAKEDAKVGAKEDKKVGAKEGAKVGAKEGAKVGAKEGAKNGRTGNSEGESNPLKYFFDFCATMLFPMGTQLSNKNDKVGDDWQFKVGLGIPGSNGKHWLLEFAYMMYSVMAPNGTVVPQNGAGAPLAEGFSQSPSEPKVGRDSWSLIWRNAKMDGVLQNISGFGFYKENASYTNQIGETKTNERSGVSFTQGLELGYTFLNSFLPVRLALQALLTTDVPFGGLGGDNSEVPGSPFSLFVGINLDLMPLLKKTEGKIPKENQTWLEYFIGMAQHFGLSTLQYHLTTDFTTGALGEVSSSGGGSGGGGSGGGGSGAVDHKTQQLNYIDAVRSFLMGGYAPKSLLMGRDLSLSKASNGISKKEAKFLNGLGQVGLILGEVIFGSTKISEERKTSGILNYASAITLTEMFVAQFIPGDPEIKQNVLNLLPLAMAWAGVAVADKKDSPFLPAAMTVATSEAFDDGINKVGCGISTNGKVEIQLRSEAAKFTVKKRAKSSDAIVVENVAALSLDAISVGDGHQNLQAIETRINWEHTIVLPKEMEFRWDVVSVGPRFEMDVPNASGKRVGVVATTGFEADVFKIKRKENDPIKVFLWAEAGVEAMPEDPGDDLKAAFKGAGGLGASWK